MYHAESIAQILKDLQTGEHGLTNTEAQKRIKKYGENKIKLSGEKISRFKIFLAQWKSPLIIILILAGAVSGFLGDFLDMSIIYSAAFINVIIGFIQEDKASKALEKLSSMIRYRATVLRNGKKFNVDSEGVVIGDVLILGAGDKVQADARLIEAKDLQINEALLTGESEPIKKFTKTLPHKTKLNDRENMVYRGTVVTSGTAKAVVVGIGSDTEVGKIAKMVKKTEEGDTPLQIQLSKLAKTLGLIIVVVSFGIFVLGIFDPFAKYDILQLFETSVAVAVAAIPEGLVISLTVILAVGMQNILKRNALVRRLISAETLGSVSVICVDKTGTITEGKMHVTFVATSSLNFNFEQEKLGKGIDEIAKILIVGILANDAYIQKGGKKQEVVGDTTDAAFLLAGYKLDLDKEKLEREFYRLDSIPFDSKKRFTATLNSHKSNNIIYIKGAPEVLLDRSSFYEENGKKFKLNEKQIKFFEKKQKDLTKEGLRVLAVGYKKCSSKKQNIEDSDLNDFVFLGLVGIKDPLRDDVVDTFKLTKQAGIRVIMITGDHKETAKAIGKKMGLSIKSENILTGDELEKMREDHLREIIKHVQIFARVEPADKIRIVSALQANGEVVAMTGDGVNDTPALKGADIGVAVGSSTDVAKEVSDLVLLDNKFSTIVSSVEEGRTIYQNIKKVVLYLLSGSFAEVILISGTLLLGLPLAVLPAQILWVNIIEDSIPVMALAFDKGEKENMKDKPRKRNEKIIDSEIKTMIIIISTIANLALFGIFIYFWKTTGDLALTRTITFLGLAVDSLLYIFSVRSMRYHFWEKNPFDNKFLNLAVLAGWLLLLLAVYFPPLQVALETVPIGLFEWSILIGFGLLNVALIETVKSFYLVMKRRKYDRKKIHAKT